MFLTIAMKDFRTPDWQILKFVARLQRLIKEQQSDKPVVLCKFLESDRHYDEAGKEGTTADIAEEFSFLFLSLRVNIG
jgi:protease II